jgi:hypothetical protein
MARTVIGIFDTRIEARKAVQELRDAGFRSEDINLITTDSTSEVDAEPAKGALKGTGVGATLGATGGLMLSLTIVILSDVEPIMATGTLVMALVGIYLGTVIGWVIGALTRKDVRKDGSGYYTEDLYRGGTLLAVRTAEDQDDQVVTIMNRHGAIDVDQQATAWW